MARIEANRTKLVFATIDYPSPNRLDEDLISYFPKNYEAYKQAV